MNDRVPGAPGQHKAIITETELQKMQNGEQFVITMTRDDQPIVEGTPYSKAAVLPDELAEKICPDVENPTPADALRELYSKMEESTDYPGCYYRMVDGEQEWINPPMTESWKAYRTTKRYNGKVVYAMKITSVLPDNASKYIGLETLGIQTIVGYSATTGTEVVPSKWQEHSGSGGLVTREIAIRVAKWGVSLLTTFDATASTCDVTVEYCID